MWLRRVPTGLSMSSRTTFGDKAGTGHMLYFTLHHAGQSILTLETGEVLQNPGYAAVRKNKQNEIDANLSLHPETEGRDPSNTNVMSYFEAVTSDDHHMPSSIHFDVSIPASDYSLLLNNIRGGLMPSSVTVGLRRDFFGRGKAVEYDYAPDGSMMLWHNAKNRHVAVDGITIDYRLIGADDNDGAVANTTKASIDAASVSITATLANLERAFTKGKTLIVTVIIVACALLYFALR